MRFWRGEAHSWQPQLELGLFAQLVDWEWPGKWKQVGSEDLLFRVLAHDRYLHSQKQ